MAPNLDLSPAIIFSESKLLKLKIAASHRLLSFLHSLKLILLVQFGNTGKRQGTVYVVSNSSNTEATCFLETVQPNSWSSSRHVGEERLHLTHLSRARIELAVLLLFRELKTKRKQNSDINNVQNNIAFLWQAENEYQSGEFSHARQSMHCLCVGHPAQQVPGASYASSIVMKEGILHSRTSRSLTDVTVFLHCTCLTWCFCILPLLMTRAWAAASIHPARVEWALFPSRISTTTQPCDLSGL